MFTRLSAAEVMSIIVAAPTGSAIRYVADGGWTVTDHLLATQLEQRAGLIRVQDRYPRPGVKTAERQGFPPDDPNRIAFNRVSIDEMIELMKRQQR